MKVKTEKLAKSFCLRMLPETLELLEEIAKANLRTTTNQIIVFIQEGIERKEDIAST